MFVTGVKHQDHAQLAGQCIKRIEFGPSGIDPLNRGVNFNQARTRGVTTFQFLQGIGADRIDGAAGQNFR